MPIEKEAKWTLVGFGISFLILLVIASSGDKVVVENTPLEVMIKDNYGHKSKGRTSIPPTNELVGILEVIL